jgi:hypothetical protein
MDWETSAGQFLKNFWHCFLRSCFPLNAAWLLNGFFRVTFRKFFFCKQ